MTYLLGLLDLSALRFLYQGDFCPQKSEISEITTVRVSSPGFATSNLIYPRRDNFRLRFSKLPLKFCFLQTPCETEESVPLCMHGTVASRRMPLKSRLGSLAQGWPICRPYFPTPTRVCHNTYKRSKANMPSPPAGRKLDHLLTPALGMSRTSSLSPFLVANKSTFTASVQY